MTISSLFSLRRTETPLNAEVMTPHSIDAKQQTETYVQYGKRLCGKVTGSITAFAVLLQKIYNAEKQRQIGDELLQAQRKKEIQNKLAEADGNIIKERERMNHIENMIRDEEEGKTALKEQYVEAKHQHGEVNKMARVKMLIGLFILLPLAVYLYLFYIDAMGIAFKGQMNLFTIYGTPFIFFGLGFALHFFAVQENRAKYLKIGAVLLFTFVFDCIIAYLVAEAKYYDLHANDWQEVPPYDIDLALKDMHVWALLFSGFVAYIIWGVVFDMTITAYENMRSNKKEMERIQQRINEVKQKIALKKDELLGVKNKMRELENHKQMLMQSLTENVHIDRQIIRTALSDFQAGWISMMAPLGLSVEQQSETKAEYDKAMQEMFK